MIILAAVAIGLLIGVLTAAVCVPERPAVDDAPPFMQRGRDNW